MSSKITPVRLFNAALDEVEGSPTGIILRGVIDPSCLKLLRIDDYQREVQPLGSQKSILRALEKGSPLPSVDLGMRGQDFTSRESAFLLKDPVYIIDGLQRISTAIHHLGVKPGSDVRIGAEVHFNTDRNWERDRFHTLNAYRQK
ncbi:MAG: hypothetical protein RIQ56_609, partial [Candidatus Parcubacteria bacterium]